MSDSEELSDAPPTPAHPSDTELESSLREAFKQIWHSGDTATVNLVRKTAEESLGLEEGFFKSESWKNRSKQLIQDEHNKFDSGEAYQGDVTVSEKKQSQSAKKSEKPPKKTAKRASPHVSERPRKKSKVSAKVQQDQDSNALSAPADSGEESPPKKSSTQVKTQKKTQSAPRLKEPASKPEPQDDDNSSELSSLVDEEPVPKKKRASSATKSNGAVKQHIKKTSVSKTPVADDPDVEEIKRLQSWLVKCGIRKVWGKELKLYETPKAKIKHLREMLSEVGMTGRYSNEKAAQIKEARELAADIEAVTEGNERWGKSGDDDGDSGAEKTRAGRRLVRGSKHFDFLSSDGEETD